MPWLTTLDCTSVYRQLPTQTLDPYLHSKAYLCFAFDDKCCGIAPSESLDPGALDLNCLSALITGCDVAGHLTERAASQGGDPHAAEAAAGEARDDIAVKRSELQRRSARLNSDQERELIEVDISILDLQVGAPHARAARLFGFDFCRF